MNPSSVDEIIVWTNCREWVFILNSITFLRSNFKHTEHSKRNEMDNYWRGLAQTQKLEQ